MLHSRSHRWFTIHAFPMVALLILVLIVWFEVTTAQVPTHITSDGTLGTEVNQSGDLYTIAGGTRPAGGQNLFHSFGQFNVGTGDTANFSSDPGVNNIIGRVTGGAESMIDGTLQSDATLFLLNPQGIMFGQNATLNINGSFHVSTADVLRLADGSEFSTDISAKSTLTMASPSAFGFLSANPASIQVQGSELAVPDNASLSFVGGDITIVGNADFASGVPHLAAPGGQIIIASVAGRGDVGFDPTGQMPLLNVESFDQLGEIEVVQGAWIDSSGEGGGTIVIRGGRLLVDKSDIFSNTFGDTNGDGTGIDIDVTEDAILSNEGTLRSQTSGNGRAGDITIHAGRLILSEQSNILNTSGIFNPRSGTILAGNGEAGNLTISVDDNINLSDGSLISASTAGGEGGKLVLSTSILTLDTSRIVSETIGGANAGDVDIEIDSLQLINGGQIFSGTRYMGDAGHVIVTASEKIFISGSSSIDNSPSGIASQTAGSGSAGNLSVTTLSLIMENRATIAANTIQSGNAGNVSIDVGYVELVNGALISSGTDNDGHGGRVTITASKLVSISGVSTGIANNSFGSGNAGMIFISTPELTMMEGAQIQAAALSVGNAGDILIEVGNLSLDQGAVIQNSTFAEGRGGNLTVNATDTITFSGRGNNELESGLASIASSRGDAGQISIAAPTLIIRDGAIQAQTTGEGRAGDIQIATETLTLTGEGRITSSTSNVDLRGSAGLGGRISIHALKSISLSGQSDENAGRLSGIISSTFSGGRAGQVSIVTPELSLDGTVVIESRTIGNSDAGTVTIEVGQLSLTGGAQIRSTSGTIIQGQILAGDGKPGRVKLAASKGIIITGTDNTGLIASGLFTQTLASATEQEVRESGEIVVSTPQLMMDAKGRIGADTGGDSRGGNIRIDVEILTLTGGAQITSSSGIIEQNNLFVGEGHGGNIIITASDSVVISGQNSGLRSDTQGNAPGGTITMQVSNLQLTDSAAISAQSTGVGNAGNIRITEADTLLLSGNSSVTTEASQAGGGNISLESEVISLTDSTLTAEAQGASQMGSDGGNVTIQVDQMALNRSTVKANARGGDGGQINIFASEAFVADAETCLNRECLDASSQQGNDGTVEIQEPDINLSDTVTFFRQSFSQAPTLVRDHCASRLHEGNVSSLVERDRHVASTSPDGVLPRRLEPAALDKDDATKASTPSSVLNPSLPFAIRLASSEYSPSAIQSTWIGASRIVDAGCRRQ